MLQRHLKSHLVNRSDFLWGSVRHFSFCVGINLFLPEVLILHFIIHLVHDTSAPKLVNKILNIASFAPEDYRLTRSQVLSAVP